MLHLPYIYFHTFRQAHRITSCLLTPGHHSRLLNLTVPLTAPLPADGLNDVEPTRNKKNAASEITEKRPAKAAMVEDRDHL